MESLDQLLLRSAEAHNRGQYTEAERFARQALDLDPWSAQAHLMIGIVEAQRANTALAIKHLEASLAENPGSLQAPLWLSTCYQKVERYPEALKMALIAQQRTPQNPVATFQVGSCHLAVGNWQAAVEAFSRILQVAPQAAQAHHGLGRALDQLGRHSEARSSYRKAVEFDASSEVYLTDLYRTAMEESDAEEATECARRILELAPEKVEAQLWLANALLELGRPAEAELHLAAAMEADSESGSAEYLLGWTLQSLGRILEAEAYFLKSISKNPVQGVAYSALVHNRRVTESDRLLLERMNHLVESDAVTVQERSRLLYGLGKAHEDLGKYEQALRFFDSANEIARSLRMGDREFDRKHYAQLFDFIVTTFTREFLAKHAGIGSPSRLPIFVVGMMRSGITLVEQILSCHSGVGAAGEQLFWTKYADRAVDRFGNLNATELQRLADVFIKQLQAIAPGKPHIVDKMPLNYAMLGVVHLAFPNAKIIHTRRSPRDTCLSIYMTPNRSRIDWAHNRSDIVFAYRQYERLMKHWRSVLPSSSLLEVSYEDIVRDQDASTRQIIDFCGLEWEDGCLRPHENPRVVVNPSVWQVRQPMYTTSMKRWENYQPWLGPFTELPELSGRF